MLYLTASFIPEWLGYIMDEYGRRVSYVPFKNRKARGQVELYRNGHYDLLRQEILRRGPYFGLFNEIRPYLQDPYQRCLHQFILEQCEIYYGKAPLTSDGHSEVEQALFAVILEGGEIDILKLQCVLPLYTEEVVCDLKSMALDEKRTDAVKYLRTIEKRKYAFNLAMSYRRT